MTATVTGLTKHVVGYQSYDSLTSTVGVVVLMLLLGLLIQHEFARVSEDNGAEIRMRALRAVIVPLCCAAGFMIAARFLILFLYGHVR